MKATFARSPLSCTPVLKLVPENVAEEVLINEFFGKVEDINELDFAIDWEDKEIKNIVIFNVK